MNKGVEAKEMGICRNGFVCNSKKRFGKVEWLLSN